MRTHSALAASLCCVALLGCGSEAADAPSDAASLLERARVLRDREDFEAAEEALAEALAADPDAPDAERAEILLERGITRERMDRPAEAEADYTAALELDPQLARAWNNRAAVRAGAGRLTEALADWDQALEVDPDDQLSLANRALARQEAGEYDAALADVATWERSAPGSFGPALRKGAILSARGDADAAVEALTEATRRANAAPADADPAVFAPAWRELAAALQATGRPRESAEAWAEAVRRDPRLAAAPGAGAARATAAALDSLQEAGFAPTGDPAPEGFALLVAREGGEPLPVLLAEPAAEGAFVLSIEQLGRLERRPDAWIAVPNDDGAALHRAGDALRRGPRPVRFLIPAEPGPPAVGPQPAPAPAPTPVGG